MTDSANDRLMILGFDGATPSLIKRWIDEGKLPTIKRLVEQGVFTSLRSVPNTSSPPAWTSFATGKNPGKHGIFRFTERNFDNYRYIYVNGAHRKARTFWEILCGDKTGCVVNVPMTYPAQPINGCMISGFDAPGAESEGACYPEEIVAELSRENGQYWIMRDTGDMLRKGAGWSRFAESLHENMEMRYRHIRYLMEKFDWNIFVTVFGETDLAQHFYWKFTEPSHPDYDPEAAEKYGSTILNVYQRMDEIIDRLLKAYPDVNVFIVSDHGGALDTRGKQLIVNWLEDVGLLTREELRFSNPGKLISNTANKIARWGYKVAHRYLSTETKLKLITRFPVMRSGAEAAVRLGGIDWSRTKAFSDGIQDDIWINLEGRDPLGIVKRAEYDEICNFICGELREAVDIKTGKPIVDAVFKRDEVYEGDYVNRAADISFRWKTDAVINGIKTKSSSANTSAVEHDWSPDITTGDHSIDGVFIAAGPKITNVASINNAELIDIAPTVLYFFDKEIPADMDGKILDAIYDESYVSSHPPRFRTKKPDAVREEEEDVYSEEDESIIEQRLRDMGYL